MDGTGDHHAKQRKAGSEGQRPHVLPYLWKLDLKDKCIHKYIHNLIYIHTYVHAHTQRTRL
jgi:hypothetical protein